MRRHALPVAAAAGAGLPGHRLRHHHLRAVAAHRRRTRPRRRRSANGPSASATRAEEVSSFLVDLFKLYDPSENRGNQVTARELLDSGASRLRSGLKDQPETKAALLATIGAVYDSLGQYQDALPMLDESLKLQAPQDARACRHAAGTGPRTHGRGRLQGRRARRCRMPSSWRSASTAPAACRARAPCGRSASCATSRARTPWPKTLYLRSLAMLSAVNAPQEDVSLALDDLASEYASEGQWAAGEAGLRAVARHRPARARRRSPARRHQPEQPRHRGAEHGRSGPRRDACSARRSPATRRPTARPIPRPPRRKATSACCCSARAG